MAHFTFKAKKTSGEIYERQQDAKDRYELYHIIRQSGDELISVEEIKIKKSFKLAPFLNNFFNRISTEDKINFTHSLSSMLKAGLALSRAISVLERQTRNETLKKVMNGISASVDKGTNFADALAQYPKIFSTLYISMVHAGEQSGSLAESLKVLVGQMERSHALSRRVRGALIYPAVIVVVMIVIAIILFTFVVPTLMKTFVDLNVQLPATTQFVLDISNAMQNQGIYIVAFIVLAIFALYKWFQTPKGQMFRDGLILKIPFIGVLTQEVNAARTARTLCSLLESGVDVVQSLQITRDVIQNVRFKQVLTKASESIQKGETMSKAFGQYTELYPVFMIEMMGVGEESGKTDEMLSGVALYYEDDVDQKTKDLSTVIEPLIMIVIAAGVGFFAVAMISPMYSLVNAI